MPSAVYVFFCSSVARLPWLFFAMAVAGMADKANAQTALQSTAPASTAADTAYVYRVAAGDELNFRFFYTPSLNTLAYVRADGRLALPLLGDVQAAGLTMAELAARVEQALAAQVRRPQVTVNVQGTGSQRVFVAGEVGRPGVQPLLGPLTVLQAVSVAEGLRETAQPSSTLIMRRGPNGDRQLLAVDLTAAMSGSDTAQDMLLQPYDVVMVPRSGIADLDRWIDQYVRRLLPFNAGFSYTINRNGVVQ